MGNYRIVIKKSAAKEIERIQKKDRIRIVEKIRSLSGDPHPPGSKKLSGQEKTGSDREAIEFCIKSSMMNWSSTSSKSVTVVRCLSKHL